MSMINNLGTRLFKSVTDKAGDLGDKFEEEFSRLSANITAEVEVVVNEVVSLSGFIKVTLVILCILLVIIIIRLLAFGARCAFFKMRDWLKANENNPPPQVILLMPQKGEGEEEVEEPNHYSRPMSPQKKKSIIRERQNTIVYADPVTTQNIENIKRESMTLFHNHPKIIEEI